MLVLRCVEATTKPTTASAITCSPYGKEKGICRFVLKSKVVAGTNYTRRIREESLQQYEDAKHLLRRYNFQISKICNETVYDVYCHYYFPACDFTTAVVLKQPVCKESCLLVFENCKKELKRLKSIYGSPFYIMNCTNLPNKNAGDLPACYHHPSLNSKFTNSFSVYLSTYLFSYLFSSLNIYLFVYLPFYLFIYRSIFYIFIHPSI